jgi:hypothetical protein
MWLLPEQKMFAPVGVIDQHISILTTLSRMVRWLIRWLADTFVE